MEKTIVENEPRVDLDLALKHGLTEEEYGMVLNVLGRVPTYTELGIYSVMWSEHCSYKNSIAVLKTLPRSGGKLLVSAGSENAGLVDIGGGFAVAFKIESHNHPSAVEPYQGAATGVGGIMRDIFTMGARPIAGLNSLRFGNLDSDRTKHLLKGVVKGIGDYGNSFGVPTVGGEVYFDPCYQENPLVNAMAVGIVKHGQWSSAIAMGAGNPVMIVGSATGRDGIHGATFASEEISDRSEAKRPSVQVGDPFTEKLLLEASLEAIRSGFVVGIQDMGAAGITCSTSEMSAKGESGMRINLDRVPAREGNMSAYELMLSESQERMLVVVKNGYERDVKAVFGKWDLHAEIIGEVIDEDRLEISYRGEVVADVPPKSLVLGGGAPVYIREAREPEYLKAIRLLDEELVPQPGDLNQVLLALLSSPSVSSKRWVYEQYDSMVRTNNVVLAQGDAAVVYVKEANKALALTTDCNSRYVYLNPYSGGMIAVAEAARNVVCTGATPLAITNCLNFGNPHKPDVYWQFREAVRGMADACRVLDTPVTGGNVSFYNEGPTASVYPTPVIGMLGIIQNLDMVRTSGFKRSGDSVILLGSNLGHLGGSEYLATFHGMVGGDAPEIDLVAEKKVQQVCLQGIEAGIVQSAHDCSEGGLAVALAECCISSAGLLGSTVQLSSQGIRVDKLLFGEDQSRIVVTTRSEDAEKLLMQANRVGLRAEVIGTVGGNRLEIGNLICVECYCLKDAYERAIPKRLD
ncbi:MAG TPA: phosphoribosylformylglycinamidine synthase subunit PurL [Bacteroidota bacterium]|nr:phosphoribosylformylglycinamidine synthase subunit PurL [Bacteroidota bacterium]